MHSFFDLFEKAFRDRLCTTLDCKNRLVAESALRGVSSPMGDQPGIAAYHARSSRVVGLSSAAHK
jgi:hypothetical protein